MVWAANLAVCVGNEQRCVRGLECISKAVGESRSPKQGSKMTVPSLRTGSKLVFSNVPQSPILWSKSVKVIAELNYVKPREVNVVQGQYCGSIIVGIFRMLGRSP